MSKQSMPRAAIGALLAKRLPEALLSLPRSEQDPVHNMIGEIRAEVGRISGEVVERVERLETRHTDIEQALSSRRGSGGIGGGDDAAPLGHFVKNHARFAGFAANGFQGKASIPVKSLITTSSVPIFPDQDRTPTALPQRRLLVRALLGQGRTKSSSVEYFKQTVRTNSAAVVAEGAQKAESNYAWSKEDAPVRTIAHWVPASRQAMEDSDMLGSLIDGELRYGLALVEETELLYGDGTGEHLHGMVPQATAFDTALVTDSMDTRYDVIRQAIAQASTADLPASGVILNLNDWFSMLGIKDGEGRYIGAGPFAPLASSLWTLPVAPTNAMAPGEFLVGAFETATTLWDRMEAEVLISSEDRDNFIKNALTVRAEERLAFAVKKPAALIHGSFGDVGL